MSVGKLKQQITAGRLTPCTQPVPPDPCPEPGPIPFIMLKFSDLDWTGGESENVAWWNTTLNNAGSYVNFNAVTVMGNRVYLYGNLDDALSLCLPTNVPLIDVAIHPLVSCIRFISVENILTEFGVTNTGLAPLQNIRLNFGRITEFYAFHFPDLKTLTISNNQIAYVDLDSPGLTYADLSSNQITSITNPSAPLLETLFLANNLLSDKDCMTNIDLSSLKVLDLSGNALSEISLYHTPGLTSLKISDQQVPMPTFTFVHATALINLEARGCQLSNIFFISNWTLTDATEVDFENNKLNKNSVVNLITRAHQHLTLAPPFNVAINKLYLHGGTNYDISGEPGVVAMYNDLKAAGVDIKCNPYD